MKTSVGFLLLTDIGVPVSAIIVCLQSAAN
jgi:hypothetical protein